MIGGYGRMGHTVATLLQASGIPFVAFDTAPERVAQGQAHGQPVLYGDISDPELLAAAHAERASLVVITIEHGASALRAVSHFRNTYPAVPVIARARDLEACSRLLEAGATQAFPEAIEASLRLGAKALQMVGAPADNVDLLIQGVRDRGYELVREQADKIRSRGQACVNVFCARRSVASPNIPTDDEGALKNATLVQRASLYAVVFLCENRLKTELRAISPSVLREPSKKNECLLNSGSALRTPALLFCAKRWGFRWGPPVRFSEQSLFPGYRGWPVRVGGQEGRRWSVVVIHLLARLRQ